MHRLGRTMYVARSVWFLLFYRSLGHNMYITTDVSKGGSARGPPLGCLGGQCPESLHILRQDDRWPFNLWYLIFSWWPKSCPLNGEKNIFRLRVLLVLQTHPTCPPPSASAQFTDSPLTRLIGSLGLFWQLDNSCPFAISPGMDDLWHEVSPWNGSWF